METGDTKNLSSNTGGLATLHKTTRYLDFERGEDPGKLDQEILQLQSIVGGMPNDDPTLPFIHHRLGWSLTMRFELFKNKIDLDDAILHYQKAVLLLPMGHADKLDFLNRLGITIYLRFNLSGDLLDLETVITYQKILIRLIPHQHPNRAAYLLALGTSLWSRFTRLGDPADIDAAIINQEFALVLLPNSDHNRFMYLGNLGDSFQARFGHQGRIADIDKAIANQKAAVDLLPDGHPDKPTYMNNLATSFSFRFRQLGDTADIDRAITLNQTAIFLTPYGDPDKPGYWSSLGESLSSRFQRYEDLADIDRAIVLQRKAVEHTPDEDPFKATYMNRLGNSLGTRFRRLGNLVDINDAIIHQQLAAQSTPDDHPDKKIYLNNIGYSLLNRFQRLGHLADIDHAITHQQAAVNLTPDEHPYKSMHLSNLGESLRSRFDRLGSIADTANAIEHHRAAVNLASDRHPDKPKYLNNLGICLLIRFERLEDLTDLSEAITIHQAAVNIIPKEHPEKAMHLYSLGSALMTRFECLKDASDLDNAITYKETGISLLPSGHPKHPAYLDSLGSALLLRFEHQENPPDLDSAINRYHEASVLIPEDDPYKPTCLTHLGKSILTRYIHHKDASDTEKALLHFSTATSSSVGPPTSRFNAAKEWMEIASSIEHNSLLDACECVIGLMPRLAWLGLPIEDRHEQLVEIGGIAREAAAAAISLGNYSKAIEWLEQGRSIVWNQILQLRTPVDKLHDSNPELADRLLEVSQLLDRGKGKRNLEPHSVEQAGQRHRALTAEWESIIEQVRSIPDFESFLKPLTLSQIMNGTRGGPVVVLNMAEKRCDALALLPGSEEIIHISFPNITFGSVIELQDDLKDMLSSNGIRLRAERAATRVEKSSDEQDCKEILSELWNNIVKPVIDSLKLPPHPSTLPHIWWCATGPLAFLPIHAAGIYDADTVDSKLSDYAVSSYTPTLSALLEPSSRDVDSSFKLLSVIQPSAPGVSYIPSTELELEKIRLRFAGQDHIALKGPEGTKARVKKAMESSNWLHLACHGVQKPDEPTKSALILEDGHLTLEEIIKLNLPNAEFAYLSACQTTAGDEKLSEEAVHIAGGMLLAGYRGVVATLWSIQDDLAPEVTDEFYSRILRDGERPDSRRAAEALHFSVQKLRSKPGVSLIDWIPFVHLGV